MGGFNPDWANAIASIESAGSGGYSAMGPTTRKGNRAYGRYQVMDFNIPSWTKKHLGRELTPQQFLGDEAAQDAVFQGEFGSYVNKYGNPQDAASAWFTGKPLSGGAGRSDILGTTGSKYVNKFNAAMGGGVAADTMQVLGKTLPKQQQRGILATPQKGPEPMQKQQPRGLLGSMGIQKMQEGAEGETGQRFYQRDSFKDTAAKMGQAFAALGSNPGVQKFTNDVANQRTETKSRNKTIDYLRANGMADMADMVEAGNLPAGGVLSAIIQKRLAGPKDGPTFRAATPEEAARYQAASGQIDMATGRFYDTSPSGGFSVTTRPDGTTIVTQGGKGGGASPKLTDGQAKNTAFFGRATSSNEILDKFEMEGTGLRQIIGENLPMGNYLLTDEGQQYDQAKRDFINAILRQESGAAIGKNEFDSANVQYFPQPGDGNAVIAQKKQNRIQKIRGLGAGMGEGRIETGGEQPTHDATGKRITR